MLSQVIQTIESLVKSFLGGNVNVAILCNHCLSLDGFCSNPTEFSIEQIVDSIAHGNMSIKCRNDLVSLKDLAPDILMSHLPAVKGLKRYEKLGSGGFGTVYRLALFVW